MRQLAKAGVYAAGKMAGRYLKRPGKRSKPAKKTWQKSRTVRGGGQAPPSPGIRIMRRAATRRRLGVRGSYVGKVTGLSKKKYVTKFAKQGWEFTREKNLTADDPHCVYVGHGVEGYEAYRAAWGAAYRSLLIRHGVDVQNWSDIGLRLGTGTGTILVQYAEFPGDNELNFHLPTHDPSNGINNHLDVVNQLVTLSLNTLIPNSQRQYRRISLYPGLVTSDGIPLATVDLENYKVEFQCQSTIKVQNRTKARLDESENPDDQDSADNIEAQPLTGRIYKQTNWKNGFVQKGYYRGSIVPFAGFNTFTGGTIIGISVTADQNNSRNAFRKPPASYYFGDKIITQGVKLDPGKIKTHSFKWDCVMYFNTYMSKLDFMSSGLTAVRVQDFGTAAMFALEKELSIGGLDNTDIQVGFQVDQKYKCVGMMMRGKAQPVFDVLH